MNVSMLCGAQDEAHDLERPGMHLCDRPAGHDGLHHCDQCDHTWAYADTDNDPREHLYVHTDHSPDEVRVFYEIPDAVAESVRANAAPESTFVDALAGLVVPR